MLINPQQLNINCCYTLLSPASHHDPNLGVEANINLYNRQLLRVPISRLHGRTITDVEVAAIAEAFPIPIEAFPIFEDETFEAFVAIALTRLFIKRYRAGSSAEDWGTGIFTGLEAYTRLANRIELAAPRAANLKDFWSLLLRDMKCGPQGNPADLFKLLAIPASCHHAVLHHFQKYATMTVEMARHWDQYERLAVERYAKSLKQPQASGKTESVQLRVPDFSEDTEFCTVAIPQHSGNDLRHDIRYAGMVHLFNALGLDLDSQLPMAVKALFENGGNIAKGASAPSNDYALTQIIRKKFPMLGLLGGCTSSFILGDSNLHSVFPVWFGKEYNDALEAIFGVSAKESIISYLDDWTLHRHGGRTHDQSPMPYNFETVCAGAKLYVNYQFSPWTPPLELGAFWCALHTFIDIDASIGGQSAKGFGRVKVDILNEDKTIHEFVEHGFAYENYLKQNLIELSEGLQTGHLCTETVVCT